MFICHPCHQVSKCPQHGWEHPWHSKSIGACERCGTTTATYDCQLYKEGDEKHAHHNRA